MENEDTQMPMSSEPTPISSPQIKSPDEEITPQKQTSQSSQTPITPQTSSQPTPGTPITPVIINPQQKTQQLPILPRFFGDLTSLVKSALNQKKWILIIILPSWGPGAFSRTQQKLHAPQQIVDNVILWRGKSNNDTERYSSFYPVDGLPHIALLDPRSQERLCVWGNVDGEGMESFDVISPILWETVVKDLETFLKEHSLENGHLGPVHRQEKSWAVRTRRVSEPKSDPNLPPTSVMDDEEAAIAAAIAASLADVNGQEDLDDEDNATVNDEENSEEMYSEDSTEEGNDADDEENDNDMNSGESRSASDTTENDQDDDGIAPSIDSAENGRIAIQGNSSSSRPMVIPNMASVAVPSSVESLSSSYIERMESCFRSSVDPELMEARRLRMEQDAELAASLEADRRRDNLERDEAAKLARKERLQRDAEARLPQEPNKNDPKSLTIAVRLSNGKRIMRRFHSSHNLLNVADFIITQTGLCDITDKAPSAVLRTPGGSIKAAAWDISLQEMTLSRRTMFMLDHH